MADQKEKVRQLVEQRGLCSWMNDTKWDELRRAMTEEMPFAPPFVVKFLFEPAAAGEERFMRQDVSHMGDWSQAYAYGNCGHAAYAIEWIRIRPRYLKPQGRLVPPVCVSEEPELVAVLKKYAIPYEKAGGVYTIYGYR